MILELDPKTFKIEWAQILMATGTRPLSIIGLGDEIERETKVHHLLEDLVGWVEELEREGLLELSGSDIRVSEKGDNLVLKLRLLARNSPEEWGKFVHHDQEPVDHT